MARNQEKAQSMLNKFLRGQQAEHKEERPWDPMTVHSLSDAERWRFDVMKQISKSISQIQNPSLEEVKLRELNDLINRLMKLRERWERRIRDLGGPDYTHVIQKIVTREGQEAPGRSGYMYFGEARNLPGVKEMLSHTAKVTKDRKSKFEMLRSIDADYYGFRDDDDGVLAPLEEAAELAARQEMEAEFERERQARRRRAAESGSKTVAADDADDDDDNDVRMAYDTFEGADAPARPVREGDDVGEIDAAALPSREAVEAAVLEHKRKKLLAKYVSTELAAQEQHAKNLAGLQR